ncbi:MAG: hypothetical protein NTU41_08540, partial [Chloroflexi bacterium]|nr:hypothetical protein [Chloroflexota bacterium]
LSFSLKRKGKEQEKERAGRRAGDATDPCDAYPSITPTIIPTVIPIVAGGEGYGGAIRNRPSRQTRPGLSWEQCERRRPLTDSSGASLKKDKKGDQKRGCITSPFKFLPMTLKK